MDCHKIRAYGNRVRDADGWRRGRRHSRDGEVGGGCEGALELDEEDEKGGKGGGVEEGDG